MKKKIRAESIYSCSFEVVNSSHNSPLLVLARTMPGANICVIIDVPRLSMLRTECTENQVVSS